MSSLVVIAAPVQPLVSLDEAKAHLRVDHGDDDGRIQALLWAAQTEFAGPDGWVGRSFTIQTLELRTWGFPGCERRGWGLPSCEDIVLPCPPLLVDVDHPLTVKYIDAAGAELTADPALYSIVTSGSKGVARIALAYGAAWPAPRWQADAVRIRFSAGYAPDDAAAEGLKAAIKLHVELQYDGADETKFRSMINLLAPYRVY